MTWLSPYRRAANFGVSARGPNAFKRTRGFHWEGLNQTVSFTQFRRSPQKLHKFPTARMMFGRFGWRSQAPLPVGFTIPFRSMRGSVAPNWCTGERGEPVRGSQFCEPPLTCECLRQKVASLLQKVASEDDDLLLGGVLLALFCHTFSPYYLGGERFSPFPAEAGYLF